MVAEQRMYDGQRIAKMLKASKGNGTAVNKNKTNAGKAWEELIYKLDYKQFPALGQEKERSSGKYVKISFENQNLNINDAHPVQIGQVLKQYFPGHTEQRKSKNCITIKTKDRKQCETIKSLKQDIMVSINGEQKKVVIEEIVSRNQCKGVVFETSWKQMSEQEIKDELTSAGYHIKEVKQMKKRLSDNTEVKTNCCVLTFDSEELPEKITMCGVNYRIREYIPNPLVCGKCQKIGHIRAKCTSEAEVCRKCGHILEDEHMCTAPQCPSCPDDDNNHAPNSSDCNKYEFEKMVMHHKTVNRVSYAKAREECTQLLTNLNSKWNAQANVNQQQEKHKPSPTSTPSSSIDEKIAAVTRELEEARQKEIILDNLMKELEEQLRKNAQKEKGVEELRRKLRSSGSNEDANKKRKCQDSITEVVPAGATRLQEKQFQDRFNQLDHIDKETVNSILAKYKEKKGSIQWYDLAGTLTPVMTTSHK